MNSPSPETIARGGDETPNVVIFTRWHQAAPLIALFSPVLAMLAVTLSPSLTGALLFAVAALTVVCIATPLILSRLVYPPAKDLVRIEPDGLVFTRYGMVPFDSITGYTLDGLIRLTRRDKPTLVLLGNRKTPGYQDLRAALGPAMATWRAHHPAARIKQSHFQGTPLAKVLGALVVISCGGLVVTVVTMETGMSSLPALAIGIFAGFRLLASEHPE